MDDTLDGSEIWRFHQLRLVVYLPLFTGFHIYIQGGWANTNKSSTATNSVAFWLTLSSKLPTRGCHESGIDSSNLIILYIDIYMYTYICIYVHDMTNTKSMYGMFTYTFYRKNDQPTVLVNYSDSYPNDPMGISQVTGFVPETVPLVGKHS